MNLLYFILFGLAVFLLLLAGGKKYRGTALYALAIGGVVNSNFFTASTHPVNCFSLPFGLDSIIYTLFIFCVIVMFIEEGKHSSYVLAISSIIAIMLSATIELIATLLSVGNTAEIWHRFLTFTISAVASLIAVFIMLEVINKIKNKTNCYVLVIVGIIIATIINSTIYYVLTMLLYGTPANIWPILLASFIGKTISLGFSLITLFLLNLFDKRNNKKII